MTKQEKKEKQIINRDLFRFKKGFEELANVDAEIDFTFKIVKNLRLLEEEKEIIDDFIKPSDEYKEKYQTVFETIAKKYCKKDKEGNPIIHKDENHGTNYYTFEPEDKEVLDAEVEKLKEDKDVKPLMEKREKQVEKYEQLLDKPCTVKFDKILRSELPSKMKPYQLNLIFELVEQG